MVFMPKELNSNLEFRAPFVYAPQQFWKNKEVPIDLRSAPPMIALLFLAFFVRSGKRCPG
jgi:hypothetical protein